jgi:ERCC4-type nuclease
MTKDMTTVAIDADDRERCCPVIPLLEKMKGVQVRVRRLAVGDYQVDDRLLFERKTLPDFALSIADGRLFRQMIRIANSGCRGALVLEGTGNNLNDVGMRREALQGALITVGIVLGLMVLRARDPAETAWLIVTAARQVRRTARGAVQRPWHRPAVKRGRQLYLLQGLPGIGPQRAERLLDAFGSVEAVFSAPCEELAAVIGIGAKTARNIRWAVGEVVLPFGSDAGGSI